MRTTARSFMILLPALAAGCASLGPKTDPGRPTTLMETSGAQMPAFEMRQRVDALVPPFLTFVEQTTDRIRAEASDPAVRRRALRLKIDMVPLVYRAAFQTDPLAAALDVWLLSYQLEDCFEAGNGPCDFGPQQSIAREAARQQRAAFDQLVQTAAVSPDAFERGRARVRETARRYPLRDEESIRYRRTMTEELLKTMDVGPVGAFEVLGDVSMTLSNLASRLNLYIDDTTRLARWHAELLAEDVADWPRVDRALTDLDRLTEAADHLTKTLDPDALNALLDRPLDLIQEERRAALADVDRQRVLTLQYLSAERQVVLDALLEGVRAERVAMLAQVREERLETLVEVERLRRDLIADSVTAGVRLVDHLVWRLAQLLGGLLVLAAILAWLLMRAGRTTLTTRDR